MQIDLTEEELTLVLNTLAQAPYRTIAPIIQKIGSQIQVPKQAPSIDG